jgi:branched-chain amino acid transport system ATP-binding protein
LELLSADSVSAYHGNIQVLYGVNLTVAHGEVVAIFGANGAGKTTLLRAIMGIVGISDGSIRLGGEEISRFAPHQIVSRGVSFVPEGRRIFPAMTVEENLAVAVPRGCPDADRRKAEVYSLFPALEERRSAQAGKLSGGEQQMVAIGRALMPKPRLLVLDEPSLGLSPRAMAKTIDALRGLAKSGMSVLLAEQNPDLALGASDRAYILENGRILFGGSSRDLTDDPGVKEAYTGVAV